MKILAINGSHRGDQGHSGYLISKIFQGAISAGVECEEFVLSKMKINRCTGCSRCHTDEFYLQCVWDKNDDVRTIFDKITLADIVIYATPVYVFGMSGLMKTFLDRYNALGDSRELRITESGLFFHHILPEICSKPFVSLVCCDNIENETIRNTREYFRIFSHFMDAPLVGELTRNAGKFMGDGKDLVARGKNPRINAIYEAYIQAGRELATRRCISLHTQSIANQEIIPVPFFSLLKQIRIKSIKKTFIDHAQEYLKSSSI